MTSERNIVAGRPLTGLGRYLVGSAPELSLRGRSLSRRIEGQFSCDAERRCYSEIVIAVAPGVGAFPDALKKLCRALLKPQKGGERGEFRIELVAFDGSAGEELRCGYKTREIRLERALSGFSGQALPDKSSRLEKLPKIDRQGLVVLVATRADDTVSPEVAAPLAKHPRRQLVRVDLHHEVFFRGLSAHAETEDAEEGHP